MKVNARTSKYGADIASIIPFFFFFSFMLARILHLEVSRYARTYANTSVSRVGAVCMCVCMHVRFKQRDWIARLFHTRNSTNTVALKSLFRTLQARITAKVAEFFSFYTKHF